jgi:hypothetical protein
MGAETIIDPAEDWHSAFTLQEAKMITIDQMIKRLQDLRGIAPRGGDTPVVISDFEHVYESAAADLMAATVHLRNKHGQPVTWENRISGNDLTVVRIF